MVREMEHHRFPLYGTPSLTQVLKTFVPFAIIIITILVANLCINHIAPYTINTTDRILIFWILALMSYAIAKFFIGIYA